MTDTLPTNIPWSDANGNILQDVRDSKERMRETHYALFNKIEPTYKVEGVPVSKTIAIVSGGLDSTTMIYHIIGQHTQRGEHALELVSFDYGQRHRKELKYAVAIARQLGLRHDIVDLTGLTHLISNSALTSQTGLQVRGQNFDGAGFHPNIEVPDGHYAEETMKQTVVPNRNMIMLSIAAGIAVNRGASAIATAVHAGDHFIYPDCRPGFIDSCSRTIALANEGFAKFKPDATGTYDEPLYTPFIGMTKADIAYRAMELGVPLHLTWSCYKGGENHCGRCGTCVERLEAIDEAQRRMHIENHQVIHHIAATGEAAPIRRMSRTWDDTTYDDAEFWRTAVREKAK